MPAGEPALLLDGEGPTDAAAEDLQAARRRDVVESCHILDRQGHDHFCFGHVSVRLGSTSSMLIKAGGLSLGGVEAHGVPSGGWPRRQPHTHPQLRDETALHTAIYRSRPDVGAVVHTHPMTVQAATMLEFQTGVYSQDGVAFAGSLAGTTPQSW